MKTISNLVMNIIVIVWSLYNIMFAAEQSSSGIWNLGVFPYRINLLLDDKGKESLKLE